MVMYDLDRLLPTKWFLRVREAAGEGKGEQRERAAALERARALSGQLLGLRPIRVAEAHERDLEGCREAREALQLESGRTVAVRNIPADCQVEDVDRLFEGLGTRSTATQVLAGSGGTWEFEARASSLPHNATKVLGHFARGEKASGRVALTTFADAAEAQRAVQARQGDFLGDFRVELAVLY